MGTHDLDKIKGDIRYRALPPEEINFVALKQDKSMNGRELFDSLRVDADIKLKEYLPIIENKPRWPIFYDENDQVLSLPPIINSEGTKISVNTTNVFIEVTATDKHRAEIVLAMLVTQFSAYCEEIFHVEPVEVTHADGTKVMTPRLDTTQFTVNLDYCNKMLGLQLTMDQVPDLLKKMGLEAKECRTEDFDVTVPATRPDILHPCDIAEDLGIAFGFNNIPRVLPPTNTEGKLLPLNKYTDLLRQEIAQIGYTEILTSGLISKSELYEFLQRDFQEHTAVQLANSKTPEFDFVRTTLLPGVLKTLYSNQKNKLPHKLFEVADVCLIDDSTDTGARNERRACILYSDEKKSGLELVHGVLDHIMKKFGVDMNPETGYAIRASELPTYFGNLQAEVTLEGESIGNFGILHPNVLKAYKIRTPCAVLELNCERIFDLFERNS